MAACGNKGATSGENFATDSLRYENEDSISEVSIYVDYPTSANATLANAIFEYISEELGGTYMGELNQIDSLIKYYGDTQKRELDKKYVEETPFAATYYYSTEIRKEFETTKYVTYSSYNETFLGGAHGSHTIIGTTFRKSDGRRFGWEMLHNTSSEAFHKIIKEGLKRYFNTLELTSRANKVKTLTDAELKDMLLVEDDVNYLPLPVSAPYLTKDGMTFIYQNYEIAAYAAGTPNFTVPLSELKPYLTQTIVKLAE